MSGTESTPKAWEETLNDLLDDCPYIGPRPQTITDEGMLIGRDAEVLRVRRAVLNRKLVILHGYSGSGKTSLLQNGLFAALIQAGFNVFVSRSWPDFEERLKDSNLTGKAKVETYITRGIEESVDDPATVFGPEKRLTGAAKQMIEAARGLGLGRIASKGTLLRTLDDSFDGKAVLVLDQFEELLRDQEDSAREIVEWIIWSGRRHRTKIIVSLRTDGLHYLDPLLRGVKPFSVDRVGIPELMDAESIQKVIETTRKKSRSRRVDPKAVSRLMKLWDQDRPNLLHLQATLYALFFLSRDRRPKRGASAQPLFTLQDVSALEGSTGAVFRSGLSESLRLKIEQAASAATKKRLDDYLVTGTREAVRRIAPFLSSRDFKVPVLQVDLANRVLARELAVLHRDIVAELHLTQEPRPALAVREVVNTLFGELLEKDILNSDFRDVAPAPGKHANEARDEETLPQSSLRSDVTSGPMMSKSAVETLFEELRRVAFAIEWLVATQIVRRDWDGVLTLVHDGSGAALRDWADADYDETRIALRQLTGARGEDYIWRGREIGGDKQTVIANLTWRDCQITSNFRNVVFVNCDFRGSRFEECRFQGVTFVNCLLDDTNFENCRIFGEARLRRVKRQGPSGDSDSGSGTSGRGHNEIVRGRARVAPSFLVKARPAEVAPFLRYLETVQQTRSRSKLEAETPSGFFSDTSGKAAIPGPPPSPHLADIFALAGRGWKKGDGVTDNIPPARGGIAMLGGRVCFLTIYKCSSHEGGSFAFHHVSGDGIDLVEQLGGKVVIHDAAVRGISVSRDSRRSSSGHLEESPRIELRVHDSLVTHLYFSDELKGSVDFDNSVVFMLINASQNSSNGFEVRLDDCRYQCLVNTHDPKKSPEHSSLEPETTYFHPLPGSHSRFDAVNRRAMANDLETMDYRSSPGEWEEQQRKRKSPAHPEEVDSVADAETAD